MSAQDNLSPQQFFHGTKHRFKKGDLVTTPESRGEESRFDDVGSKQQAVNREHVHMSTSWGDAYDIARRDAGGRGTPKVYQVEPTGEYEPDPHDRGSALRSKQPLRVVKNRTWNKNGGSGEWE